MRIIGILLPIVGVMFYLMVEVLISFDKTSSKFWDTFVHVVFYSFIGFALIYMVCSLFVGPLRVI
jgi:hypothetical protein